MLVNFERLPWQMILVQRWRHDNIEAWRWRHPSKTNASFISTTENSELSIKTHTKGVQQWCLKVKAQRDSGLPPGLQITFVAYIEHSRSPPNLCPSCSLHQRQNT